MLDPGTKFCGVGSQRRVSGQKVPFGSISVQQHAWRTWSLQRGPHEQFFDPGGNSKFWLVFQDEGELSELTWPQGLQHISFWHTEQEDFKGVGSLFLTGRVSTLICRPFSRNFCGEWAAAVWYCTSIVFLEDTNRGGLPLRIHWPRQVDFTQLSVLANISLHRSSEAVLLHPDWLQKADSALHPCHPAARILSAFATVQFPATFWLILYSALDGNFRGGLPFHLTHWPGLIFGDFISLRIHW